MVCILSRISHLIFHFTNKYLDGVESVKVCIEQPKNGESYGNYWDSCNKYNSQNLTYASSIAAITVFPLPLARLIDENSYMKSGKLQRSKQDAKINVGMSSTLHNILFCAFKNTLHELPSRDLSGGDK